MIISIKSDRLSMQGRISLKNGQIFDPYIEKTVNILTIKTSDGMNNTFQFFLNEDENTNICHISFVFSRGKLEISYGTNEQYRKNGYMSEALATFIRWFFTETTHSEIYALICNNPTSQNILEKNNFVKSDDYEKGGNWFVLTKTNYEKHIFNTLS